MSLAVVVNRAARAVVTLAGVAIVVFFLLRVVPGDPIAMMISPGASAADIAALRAHYGLDAGVPTQFATWARDLAQRDFPRRWSSPGPRSSSRCCSAARWR